MRIVCPSCQAAYEVPSSVLDAAQALRCARCSAEFTPVGDPAAAPPVAVPAPAPVLASAAAPDAAAIMLPALPVSAPAEERPATSFSQPAGSRARPRAGVALAWVVSLALLAAAAWGFVAERAPIARAWPAAGRIYAALGY